MSADNGWVIRQNAAGRYVLQMYFASADNYPDVNDPRCGSFPTLDEAVRHCAELESVGYPSEYGLTVLL